MFTYTFTPEREKNRQILDLVRCLITTEESTAIVTALEKNMEAVLRVRFFDVPPDVVDIHISIT